MEQLEAMKIEVEVEAAEMQVEAAEVENGAAVEDQNKVFDPGGSVWRSFVEVTFCAFLW